MFVYQNKEGNICVTFTDNKPVETPEYVIAIDEDAKALYMVSGTIETLPEEDEAIIEETPVIDVPTVEELDNVVENDPPVEEVEVTENEEVTEDTTEDTSDESAE